MKGRGSHGATNYYILRQVDLDGKSKEYPPISIENPLQQQLFTVSAGGGQLSVQVSALNSGAATLNILDMQGKKIVTHNLRLEKGINQLQLPFGTMPTGIYVGTLTSEAGAQRVKFISK